MMVRQGAGLLIQSAMVFGTAAALLAAGREALDNTVEHIDLAAVSEADSTALAVLLGWARTADSQGHRLRFIHLPDSVQALIKLYGLDTLFFPERSA